MLDKTITYMNNYFRIIFYFVAHRSHENTFVN